MQDKKDTQSLLAAYFQKEKKIAKSKNLKECIARQTIKKKAFNWKSMAMPVVAATILLVLGLSLWIKQEKKQNTEKIASQTEVIYEDEDFIIYIKE